LFIKVPVTYPRLLTRHNVVDTPDNHRVQAKDPPKTSIFDQFILHMFVARLAYKDINPWRKVIGRNSNFMMTCREFPFSNSFYLFSSDSVQCNTYAAAF